MAILDFVFRVSGTVAYSDGSHGPFEAIYNSASGGIVTSGEPPFTFPYADEAAENFKNMGASLPAILSETLAFIPTLASAPDAATDVKTATDATFFITGTIARTDQSSGSFAIEYFKDAVNFIPDVTDAIWTEILAESETSDIVLALFDSLGGVGTASV